MPAARRPPRYLTGAGGILNHETWKTNTMPSNHSTPIRNYQQAKVLLDLRRQQGRPRAKLRKNVYLERRLRGEVECFAVKFHETDIVTYLPTNRIILRCGGWYTPTTKANISRFSPFTVRQDMGVWYIDTGPRGHWIKFKDGMILNTPEKHRQKLPHSSPRRSTRTWPVAWPAAW